MNLSVMHWAIRHRVSAQALEELRAMFGELPTHIPQMHEIDKTEAYTQSLVRLEAAAKGYKLFRNNNGVAEHDGHPVRYGLANDSERLNKKVKSADLIGWKSILITPAHVGSRIAQFVSRECKRPNWKWSGDEHETAQAKWRDAVISDGGDACFCSGQGTL